VLWVQGRNRTRVRRLRLGLRVREGGWKWGLSSRRVHSHCSMRVFRKWLPLQPLLRSAHLALYSSSSNLCASFGALHDQKTVTETGSSFGDDVSCCVCPSHRGLETETSSASSAATVCGVCGRRHSSRKPRPRGLLDLRSQQGCGSSFWIGCVVSCLGPGTQAQRQGARERDGSVQRNDRSAGTRGVVQ